MPTKINRRNGLGSLQQKQMKNSCVRLSSIVLLLAGMLYYPSLACAQLLVTTLPVKVMGSKAVLKLAMKNSFGEGIKSARAVCFVMDSQGRMIAQSAKWVIGQNMAGLDPGATNSFSFVVTSPEPFATTNLTAQISFTRLVMADGTLADVRKDVVITKR